MECSTLYHVTSSPVSPEVLFRKQEDIDFFQTKLIHYVSPIATIHFLSLSPIAIDLIVEIKDIQHVTQTRLKSGSPVRFSSRYIIQQFSSLLNSYALHYNFQYKRSGSLFRKNFRYDPISNDQFSDVLAVLS